MSTYGGGVGLTRCLSLEKVVKAGFLSVQLNTVPGKDLGTVMLAAQVCGANGAVRRTREVLQSLPEGLSNVEGLAIGEGGGPVG